MITAAIEIAEIAHWMHGARNINRAVHGGCHSQSGSEKDLGNKPGLSKDREPRREKQGKATLLIH